MATKIIAVGGQAFDYKALINYYLKATGKPVPKVCFVPTASGDSERYIAEFETAFSGFECDRTYFTIFRKPTAASLPHNDLEQHLMAQDLVFVGGGNTRAMLAVWRNWGLDDIFRRVWQSGTVMAGVSAGALSWFECGGSDSTYSGQLSYLAGIGLLSGSCTPHYHNASNRRPDVHGLMKAGTLPPGIGIDDGAAVLFADGQLSEVVIATPSAQVVRLTMADGQVVESLLDAKTL